jgi:hypothetical protein
MKRKFFGMLLMGAMTVASVGMFTSCKDYDDDINNLQKQIDGITSQKLQDQLTTLQSALNDAKKAASDAQTTANTAVANAKAADDAAKAAQGTADAAAKAAEAAQKAAEAAQATADAAATKQQVAVLESAIADLKGIIGDGLEGKTLTEAITNLEAKILTIDEKLLTLVTADDVKDLLKNADFAENAVIQNLKSQVEALNAFKSELDKLGPIGDADWQVKVDAAITKIADIEKAIAAIQADINGIEATDDAEAVKGLKQKMEEADAKIQSLDNVIKETGSSINILKIFLKRDLKSLVLRPSMYFGGIEGVVVNTFDLPKEKNNPERKDDMYRYFDRDGSKNISDYGYADYHVNPTNVDLKDYAIDFYNWTADIKGPVTQEDITETRIPAQARTRSGNEKGIHPVFDTTEKLFADNANYFKNGILTVPFKADAAAIEADLLKGKGTIASLSMTKVGKDGAQDTTVNSDYAIVVPRYGYGLLIGDNTFESTTPLVYEDNIGLDNTDPENPKKANSANLHRSFSFLALAATAPTHEIKYDGKFNISEVLESRIVLKKADWEAIKDTAVYVSHTDHQATAVWDGEKTANPEKNGDCTIDAAKVHTLSATEMERLGLTYDIQLVDYVLGSNKTGETVHLTLETDENGDVWARPCNVTADGKTITATEENPANAACVGRQPIVCIMVKHGNDIVSFAYMKFLITPDAPVPPVSHNIEFELDDIYVNCEPVADKVTWSEIEYHLLDQELEGMSKADFDKKYVFDYYAQEEVEKTDAQGATIYTVIRKGFQYDEKGKRRATAWGVVAEEWNKSKQGVEDATTHIIKWSFTAEELAKIAKELKANGKLELSESGKDYVNKEAIETYVRYAQLPYVAGPNSKPEDAAASIWIKLILKPGKLHVAKGNLDGSKILTYWYQLNSKTNAVGTGDAKEVRINVPVPVPNTNHKGKNVGYTIDETGDIFGIEYDNLLEKANDPNTQRTNTKFSEFTKDLKDFFVDGELTASLDDEDGNFDGIDDVKLGCEFILPSTIVGNATFNAGTNHTIKNSWIVQSYSGAEYTLSLNDTHTKILIWAKDDVVYEQPKELITLNYDYKADADKRQITVVNYVNGEDQDDILNYKTHNELGELETFTAYIQIHDVKACAPVYFENMWFNARFLRPLDLENPSQALAPDATNNWKTIDLTDALIVKDWRDFYGDRKNRTGGKDVSLSLPGVGNQKAFDYVYYQVKIEIDDQNYYTDANLGTEKRSDNFTLGHMPVIQSEKDAKAQGFIKVSQIPNLNLKKVDDTKLKYMNYEGVTGGFHVFVPITMSYVYGSQTVKQTKWVTLGVTSSVNQVQFGK